MSYLNRRNEMLAQAIWNGLLGGAVISILFISYWLMTDKRRIYLEALLFRDGEIGWDIATLAYTLYPIIVFIAFAAK
jgi:hypothetical protein